MTVVLLIAGVALVSWLLCVLLAHPRLGPRIVDRPGARSLHDRPTPRTGGLAMLGALALGMAGTAVAGAPLWMDGYVVAAVLLVAAVSFLDDLWGLHAAMRITAHALAAAALLAGGYALPGVPLPGGVLLPSATLGAAVSFLFVVWMANLYNFMDGMDGFAGGMGMCGFAALALIAWAAEAPGYALAAALAAAANAGFLAVNFPPARIFMGDVGSVPMGVLAATLALAGMRQGLFSVWVPLLVFSPFVVDATVTVLRRALQRKRIWEAHREHYYQRLVLMGWSHRRTALASYAIMIAAAATAVWVARAAHAPGEALAVAGWAAVYAVLALLIGRMERQRTKGWSS